MHRRITKVMIRRRTKIKSSGKMTVWGAITGLSSMIHFKSLLLLSTQFLQASRLCFSSGKQDSKAAQNAAKLTHGIKTHALHCPLKILQEQDSRCPPERRGLDQTRQGAGPVPPSRCASRRVPPARHLLPPLFPGLGAPWAGPVLADNFNLQDLMPPVTPRH